MRGRDVKVSLRRWSETGRNALNEPTGDWLEIAGAWAEVAVLTDAERVAAGEVGAATIANFVVRSTSVTRALTADDIIRVGAGEFAGDWDVKGVVPHPKGRRRMVVIRAAIKSDKGGA